MSHSRGYFDTLYMDEYHLVWLVKKGKYSAIIKHPVVQLLASLSFIILEGDRCFAFHYPLEFLGNLNQILYWTQFTLFSLYFVHSTKCCGARQ